jgi:ribosomal protein S18 acetylase RimI-like enzyme
MTQAGPNRTSVERDRLAIRPLTEEIRSAFEGFSCGDADLDDFIKSDALRLQSLNVTQTYTGWCDGEPVGYVSLMTDAVILQTRERERLSTPGLSMGSDDHPVVPALKIARIAVDARFKDKNRGCGTLLARFAYLTALDVASVAGCRLLTLDAYPESMGFYEKLGFQPNRAKEYRERNHPSMRLDLFAAEPPDWV